LISLVLLYKTIRQELTREEKYLFLVFAAFLASFLLSATLNGWTENSYKRIGTEFKYLLFLPLYLLLRQHPHTLRYFMWGILLGGIVLGLQAVHDTFFSVYHRGQGKYGPITFGDFAVAIGFLALMYAINHAPTRRLKILGFLSFLMAILAAFLTGSRNAWLTMILLALLVPFLQQKGLRPRYVLGTYALVVLLAYTIFFVVNNPISRRAELAIQQTQQYFDEYKKEDHYKKPLTGSANIRLEQWRIALRAFRDAPWFGYGGGNAGRTENEYIKRGLGHPDLYNPKAYHNISGIHSTYFETLLTEGAVGLVIVLLFYGYPLWFFVRNRRKAPYPASLGIVLVTGYMLFGLTENPITSDGFSSLYLTALAVIFSSTINKLTSAGDARDAERQLS